PAPDAHGGGECDSPARDRRQEGRSQGARRAARDGRNRRPPQPPAGRALGRPAAACRRRAGADHEAEGPLRRRADGQPRLLGVAMVSGSFVLTDTITRGFDHIFSSSYGNTDAVVSGKKLVDFSSSGNATVSRALLEQIRAQRDVAAAAGAVLDFSGNSTTAK